LEDLILQPQGLFVDESQQLTDTIFSFGIAGCRKVIPLRMPDGPDDRPELSPALLQRTPEAMNGPSGFRLDRAHGRRVVNRPDHGNGRDGRPSTVPIPSHEVTLNFLQFSQENAA